MSISTWDTLTENSTMPSGSTALQHLKNQRLGEILIGMPMEAEAEMELSINSDDELSVNLSEESLHATISRGLSVDLDEDNEVQLWQ